MIWLKRILSWTIRLLGGLVAALIALFVVVILVGGFSRTGSQFLADLNARTWPADVRLEIVGGLLMPSAPVLGDGVVAVESLLAPGAPTPILVAASHRGLLVRLFESEQEPPAIPVVMGLLSELGGPE